MQSPALKAAVELTVMPSRAKSLRDGPLPDGVTLLLRVAAGDEAAENEAVQTSERSLEIVRESAAFFIEQMLLHPDADSYRVLGARASASSAELRQNMALLIRWLHPDSNREVTRAVFVNRVNRAWDDLKTTERRQAYDKILASRPAKKQERSRSKGDGKQAPSRGPGPQGAFRHGLHTIERLPPSRWRRAFAFFFGPRKG